MVKQIHQSTFANKGTWHYENRLRAKLTKAGTDMTAHEVPVLCCPSCGAPRDCWRVEADGTLEDRFICAVGCGYTAYVELVDCEGVKDL